ncbi:hypothetical protein DVV91_17075 [Clostridium botulinum]|uniref:hypothetical protein n=1 Tax=Clostridium botulinum TaxID=1491 RepID=UPI001967B9C0|nr:hypothetical protein [Clostridium botulinum]MBN1076036.1 hypothetical protein [Clostridium botulinum]
MKVIELKNGRSIDSEEIEKIIVNGQTKDFDKTKHFDVIKILHESLKNMSSIKVVLEDETIIKTGEVARFILF